MIYENNDSKIKNVNSRNSVTLQICKVIPICHESNRRTSNQMSEISSQNWGIYRVLYTSH
jgi:hypothetical protein